jgi:acyl carrier protein
MMRMDLLVKSSLFLIGLTRPLIAVGMRNRTPWECHLPDANFTAVSERKPIILRRPMSTAGADDETVNSTMKVLQAIWCDVFDLDGVNVTDNFFDLGGHSLLATQIAARAKADLGMKVRLSQILGFPTIAELAAEIGRNWSRRS